MKNGTELEKFLASQQPGSLPSDSEDQALSLLKRCWHALEGSADQAMSAAKLDRAERLTWEPPILSFIIERHGGPVLGSTRAELHRWEIDVGSGIAQFNPYAGRRQLRPLGARLNVKPIAEEIARCVLSRADHRALKWSKDKTEVRLLIGDVIPNDGFKQTIAGRRKRLKTALRTHLPQWHEVRPNVWQPAVPDRAS